VDVSWNLGGTVGKGLCLDLIRLVERPVTPSILSIMEKAGTEAVYSTMCQHSRLADQIIYNSKISANQHEKVGYRAHKSVVIPNGFDTEIFASSSEAVVVFAESLVFR
jgi:glycosyltransferase involved in cell wall biosynthesis